MKRGRFSVVRKWNGQGLGSCFAGSGKGRGPKATVLTAVKPAGLSLSQEKGQGREQTAKKEQQRVKASSYQAALLQLHKA